MSSGMQFVSDLSQALEKCVSYMSYKQLFNIEFACKLDSHF
jgi:hypothetical protein